MIETRTEGPLFVATMSRPPQNAIDETLVAALRRGLDEAEEIGATAVLLRSGIAHFCGGADPGRIAAWFEPREGEAAIARDAREWSGLFGRIASFPGVVIAEIRGNALGAGLGLALACDLRIASTNARLGVPEARVGLLPAGLTVHRLEAACGLVTAQRLLLGGAVVNGAEAHALGMVHLVSDDLGLAGQGEELARRVARQSRAALIEAKALLGSAAVPRGTAASQAGDSGSGAERMSEALDREVAALSRLIGCEDTRHRVGELLARLAGGA